MNAGGVVLPNDRLDVVSGASPRRPPLHIDDGAEAALIRTAATGVEAGHGSAVRRTVRSGDTESASHRRRANPSCSDRAAQARLAWRLATRRRDAPLLPPRRVKCRVLARGVRRVAFRKHGDGARNVKSADAHLHAGLSQRRRDIEGARHLIGLDADQHHHSAAVAVLTCSMMRLMGTSVFVSSNASISTSTSSPSTCRRAQSRASP